MTLESALRRRDRDAAIEATMPTINMALKKLYSHDSASSHEDMLQSSLLAVTAAWDRFEHPIDADRWKAYSYGTARKAALKSIWKYSTQTTPLSLDVCLAPLGTDTGEAYDIVPSSRDTFEEAATNMMLEEIVSADYLTEIERERIIKRLCGISLDGADIRGAKLKLQGKWNGEPTISARGKSPVCRNGKHEMTTENTLTEGSSRRCRQCRLDRRRKT